MNDVRIAIYIRLSMADEETGKSRDESNSIIHQRMLIHHFLDTHPTLSGYPRIEFVDDGFSGTNTDRPAFQRMIAMIKTGQYNLCITKDFSRFARDYIEMGDYLECLFPFLHVRYISINDGYDSDNYKGTTGGLDVVMRSIVYAAYSRDLSVKMMSGKEQSRKKKDRKVYTEQDYPLKGLVFCGICGRSMARNRKYERMYCRGAKLGDEGWEYKAGILSEKRLEETVFKEIRNMISLAEAKDSHSESHISKVRCENLKKNASVVDTYKNRELLKKQKFQVYESYSAGLINKEEYLKKRQELDDKLNSLENEQYQEQDVAEYEHTKLNSLYECFRDCDSLTTEMAQVIIKKVMIFPDDRIEIIWRFTDMLEESVNQ